MRVYLAYKFQYHKNKEALKSQLEELAAKVESWGHTTFLLARDTKNWQHVHLGFIKHIPIIFSNIKKSDIVLAYIDSGAFSKGLMYETLILNLLNKKSVLVVNNSSGKTLFSRFFKKTVYVNSLSEINETFLTL